MEINKAVYLLKRYFNNEATLAEQEALFQALEENRDDEEWQSLMEGIIDSGSSDSVLKEKYEKMLRNILETKPKAKFRRLYYFTAAASVLLVLLAGYMYFFNPTENIIQPISGTDIKTEDVAPGSNKAVLTLADGSKIILDSAFNGTLSQQGGVTVIKLDDGKLSYQKDATNEEALVYNTITTPRGGQYQLTLSDGTKVWLNAESSLRYPTAFIGNDRKVELTGEGYFEVARNEKMLFYVATTDMTVKVLGTHFNINAYPDGSKVQTTLLEGRVQVSNGSESVLMHPGEQAERSGDRFHVAKNVNTDNVVAWKNGLFRFDDTNIQEVMRQISRWYDVEVSYPQGVPHDKYWGSIRRDQNLSEVLDVLKESGAQFKIEGRKVVVTQQ